MWYFERWSGALAGVMAVIVIACSGVAHSSQIGSGAEVEPAHIPAGAFPLGSLRLPVRVLAGGEWLSPGTYQLRVTADQAEAAPGQTGRLERYAEYVQNGRVVARTVAIIVPGTIIASVANDRPPRQGQHRIDRLREDDYLRIWFNHRGDHVLLHHPMDSADWVKRD